MIWDNAKVIKFIRLYKEKRELWDPKCAKYLHRDTKSKAWGDIALEMGCEVSELRVKMDSLMAGLRRERMKIKRALQSGLGRRESKWFVYDELQFLAERNRPCKRPILKSHQIRRTSQSHLSPSGATSSNYEDTHQYRDTLMETIELITSENETPHTTSPPHQEPESKTVSSGPRTASNPSEFDECQMFGNFIACKLRTYNYATKNSLQHKINTLIYLADCDQLDSVQFQNVGEGQQEASKIQIINTGRVKETKMPQIDHGVDDLDTYQFVIKEEIH